MISVRSASPSADATVSARSAKAARASALTSQTITGAAASIRSAIGRPIAPTPMKPIASPVSIRDSLDIARRRKPDDDRVALDPHREAAHRTGTGNAGDCPGPDVEQPLVERAFDQMAFE